MPREYAFPVKNPFEYSKAIAVKIVDDRGMKRLRAIKINKP